MSVTFQMYFHNSVYLFQELGLRLTLFDANEAKVINTFTYEVRNPSPQKNFEVATYATPWVTGTPQPDVKLAFKIKVSFL